MDRTSALDSAFLHLDTRGSTLHIASLAVFPGPVPRQDEARAAIARKLPLVPRWRQRLVRVPLSLGRPVWVDDPDFDLAHHVHRAAVPYPGGVAETRDVVERLLSEPLDRDLPLWQDWVLEGLADGRWALLTKVHHSMVDGIAGTDLLGLLLDPTPEPGPVPLDRWHPERPPGRWHLVTDAVRDGISLRVRELRGAPTAVGAAVGHGLRHPRATAEALEDTARGVAEFARNLLPTAGSSLIGPLGHERGYAWTEVDLATVLAIRERFGGTVNDVVLAAVTSAFRDLLLARGEEADAHGVRAMVPVSVRHPDQRGHFDNRVSTLLAELPVELEDPRDRLTEVAIRMRALKESHEAQVGEQITELANAVPPVALSAFLHAAFRIPHRNLTTVITNVPGPSQPLYFLGRPLLSTYPYVPVADRLRCDVAVTSYDGRLLFGVTTDRDSMPDAQVFVDGITRGFTDLAALAGAPATERTVAR